MDNVHFMYVGECRYCTHNNINDIPFIPLHKFRRDMNDSNGSTEYVIHHINTSADVNSASENGYTLLHHASYYDDVNTDIIKDKSTYKC